MMPGIPRYTTESQRMRGAVDCDEVFPGIIVGTGRSAKNMDYLNRLGITHVVNAAENDVHLNPAKLRKQGIAYKGFRLGMDSKQKCCKFARKKNRTSRETKGRQDLQKILVFWSEWPFSSSTPLNPSGSNPPHFWFSGTGRKRER